MFEHRIKKMFFNTLEGTQFGQLTVNCPDGESHTFRGQQDGETAEIRILSWKVAANVLIRGDIGFAEDYRDRLWDTPDLTALLTFVLQNDDALAQFVDGSRLSQLLAGLKYLMSMNTLSGSRKNIHRHYDLGNDFYQLWLDPSMTYSSGIFANSEQPLLDAQHAKYDRIINRFEAGSGNILEIGCGWGGFAERALDQGDFSIKGITLSREQQKYAVDRLTDNASNASVELKDYRLLDGKYDQVVSIEMFEAVGERYWSIYFNKIASLLTNNGKALLQTITVSNRCFAQYRRGADMIRTFIFPGGMLPSPQRFSEEAEKAGLKFVDQHSFGKDYALTLQHWLKGFDEKRQEVLALGFDDQFIRIWRFYFAACIASFMVERTDVMQVELAHA